MVQTCFRHQHPEAYQRDEVPEPSVPTELRYGSDRIPDGIQEYQVEETMGDPGARPIVC